MLIADALHPLPPDVLVVGVGPAGLAIARACADEGLAVTAVAPAPRRPWAPTYGVWMDELDGRPEVACVEALYPAPAIELDDRRRFVLSASYARLSAPALQSLMLDRAERGGVRLVEGAVAQVTHHDRGAEVCLEDGRRIEAAVVVDASGAGSPLVAREEGGREAYQAAYGELLEVAEHDYDDGEMALMDLRGGDPGEAPTFLYALPLGPRRLFVEETSLVRRPALPQEALRRRLAARLARLARRGLRVRRVLATEVCRIPMGTPLPRRSQRTIGYGAAGGMIHPASGYQLARALQGAEPTARALAQGLVDGPATAAARAYAAIWPRARLRAWALYTFGMDALASFDLSQLRGFLDAFFRLPGDQARRFLRGDLSPAEICVAMARTFARVDAGLRTRLLRLGAGAGSRTLLRAALPGDPP